MIRGHVGDDARKRCDNVCCIQPAAHARLPDDEVAVLLGEIKQRHNRHNFKEGGMSIAGKVLKQWLQSLHQAGDGSLADAFAIYLNALAK
jgi:hypothetical protein